MGGVAPGLFAGVVQYNQDNRAFEGATHTNITIDVVCETLQSGSDPLTQWGVLNTMLTDGQCTAFNYSEMIMAMRDTSLTAPAAEGGRQWTYQTCAEFGFYQTSSNQFKRTVYSNKKQAETKRPFPRAKTVQKSHKHTG